MVSERERKQQSDPFPIKEHGITVAHTTLRPYGLKLQAKHDALDY